MSFKDHETARHKHKSNSKFSAQSVQGIYSLHNCLNLSNRRHAPNAIGRHFPPDLPSRTIPALSKRVTLCLSFHSATFVHKVSLEKVYADNTNHAILNHKIEFIARFRYPRRLSRRCPAPWDYLCQGLTLGHGAASYHRCWSSCRCPAGHRDDVVVFVGYKGLRPWFIFFSFSLDLAHHVDVSVWSKS
jgi:hypothetical protein